MILDICAQKQTYEPFFDLLGKHCSLEEKEYRKSFQKIFQDQYEIVHRLESLKIRNIAKFFAHLLADDAISWKVCNFFSTQMHYLHFLFRYYIVFI
jgi:pre-mRNA-splicing factor CWC22